MLITDENGNNHFLGLPIKISNEPGYPNLIYQKFSQP